MIAILTEGSWAFGRLYGNLAESLRNCGYSVEFFDWTVDICRFKDGIDGYTRILGNSHILTILGADIVARNLSKFVITIHSELINHPTFCEKLQYSGVVYTGVNYSIVSIINDTIKGQAFYTPLGVNVVEFPKNRKVTKITKIGQVNQYNPGSPYEEIKRGSWLIEIAAKLGLPYEFIQGHRVTATNEIYRDIDLLVVTSKSEGFGLSILEAIACGIPVISTNVGCAKMLRNIEIFESIEQACEIIKNLSINEYCDAQYEEVQRLWNWDYIAKTYWLPLLSSS